ncbi:hypothetical protein [Marinifilum flexuosum]|uniref:hypothetical protein n=1 Tax=Marinifilum flexuosum TaxID=1117708 RepID=UPI0024946BC2|nr:hypothetical protein [Marinifilum flexuosum]
MKRVFLFLSMVLISVNYLFAQVQSIERNDISFNIFGKNCVLINEIKDYQLHIFVKNNTGHSIKLNKSIYELSVCPQGLFYELQVFEDDKFHSFRTNHPYAPDVDPFILPNTDVFFELVDSHIFQLNPFVVFHPNKANVFRLRSGYGDEEGNFRYSGWFYIYVFEKKNDLKQINHLIEVISKYILTE